MLRRWLAFALMLVAMTLTRILIRSVCLVALMQGTAYGIGRLSGQSGDANIGAGLMAFVVVLSASAAWAFADGRSGVGVGPLLVSWLVVAMLVGIATVMVASLQEPDFDLEVLRSDLVNVSTFIAGLVMVPATIGALLGTLGNRGRVSASGG